MTDRIIGRAIKKERCECVGYNGKAMDRKHARDAKVYIYIQTCHQYMQMAIFDCIESGQLRGCDAVTWAYTAVLGLAEKDGSVR